MDMSEQANYALYEKIYIVCEQIPHGKVASYGDIATIVGGGCDARTVGYALNEIPKGRNVPWQRIIAKDGAISTRGLAQRQLLEDEGIEFDARDHDHGALSLGWPQRRVGRRTRLPDASTTRRR
jgi:alkylated DNA nucleotide flippase Atl1